MDLSLVRCRSFLFCFFFQVRGLLKSFVSNSSLILFMLLNFFDNLRDFCSPSKYVSDIG